MDARRSLRLGFDCLSFLVYSVFIVCIKKLARKYNHKLDRYMFMTLGMIGFSLVFRLVVVSLETHDSLNKDVDYDVFDDYFWSFDPFILLFIGLCFDLTRLYLIAAALRIPDRLICWARFI
jgi:hypothetical protein